MWNEFVGIRSEGVRHVVEQGAVRKFAEAIGDRNPLYLDEAAGRKSRHGRRIAPPTFPISLDYGSVPGFALPESGLIHGEQIFEYERPLYVGEEILCYGMLKEVYEKKARAGSMTFLIIERAGEGADGERIFTTTSSAIITEAVQKEIEG
ncbi:MaoC family dehydratase N-terminal domain-containing protein [soil metagenome]|nr:MaoC family dehydratase N-terminal domain-containing protein [Gemmatimonadota bacterium]